MQIDNLYQFSTCMQNYKAAQTHFVDKDQIMHICISQLGRLWFR